MSGVQSSLRAASLRGVRDGLGGGFDDALIFDAWFNGDLVDRISGVPASFERASIAGVSRGGVDYTVDVDYPRFDNVGLLLEGATATDPITGVARATEAADALGNGVSWLLDDIPLVKGALQGEGTMVLDWMPGFDISSIATERGLVSCSDDTSSILYINEFGGNPRGARSHDGVYFPAVTDATQFFSEGDSLSAVVRWGVNFFAVQYTNGGNTWGTSLDTFSGSFVLGAYLRLHYANELSSQYKRLRFYNRALTEEEVVNV